MVKSYRKLKLKTFIALQGIPKELDKTDRDVQRLVILTGKTEDYFEELPFEQLQKEINKIGWLDMGLSKKINRSIWINGRRYKAKTNVSEYSTKSYLAFKSYGKYPIVNLHNIIAWIYRPSWGKFNPNKSSAIFLEHVTISQIYGCFFLFSIILQKQKIILEFSLDQAMKTLTNHFQEVAMTQSKITTAGITH